MACRTQRIRDMNRREIKGKLKTGTAEVLDRVVKKEKSIKTEDVLTPPSQEKGVVILNLRLLSSLNVSVFV